MSKEELIAKYKKEIDEFQAWIETQPRLPKKIDPLLLLRHLKIFEFDLEKAKNLLVANLETRKRNPELFIHRDILSNEHQLAMKTFQFFGLPKNTKENYKIVIFRLDDPEYKNFSLQDILKMCLMSIDAHLVDCDPSELIAGSIMIIDVANMGVKHLTQLMANIPLLKAYSLYLEDDAPVKAIHNHFVKCSSSLEKIMSAMNPFLNQKVRDSFKFHTSFETLHEYIPKELLPIEYGGSEFTLAELHEKEKDFIMERERRDYLESDQNWQLED